MSFLPEAGSMDPDGSFALAEELLSCCFFVFVFLCVCVLVCFSN